MRRLFVLPLLVLTAVACGESSPVSPSATVDGGATINGAVVSGGSGGGGAAYGPGATASDVPAGLVVSVDGTSLGAPVSSGGAFTLTGVPSGDINLRFSSQTVNGTIPLADVQQNQTIDLMVSVSATTVELEAQARVMGGDTELEGRIEAFPDATAADDLIVAGKTVLTDDATVVYLGNTSGEFDDLQIGWRVHVKGNAAGSDVLATSILVQNVNADIPFPINGIIEHLTGTEDDFEFMIGRHLIRGDAATEYFGNTVFADVADGEFAEVKTWLRDGYFYAFRLHIETDDEPEDEDEEEEQQESASVEGILTGLAGLSPDLTFMVGTTTILTNASTVVQRKGDVQSLDQLVENMLVHVVGDRQPDGSIVARRVQIKGDEPGAAFQVSGHLGGLAGTCPAVAFTVMGYAIVTDAMTTYDPAAPGCPGLKPGQAITVDGIVQAGGTILAIAIRPGSGLD